MATVNQSRVYDESDIARLLLAEEDLLVQCSAIFDVYLTFGIYTVGLFSYPLVSYSLVGSAGSQGLQRAHLSTTSLKF